MGDANDRYMDYIDSLREWRGSQDAKYTEIARRLTEIESGVKGLDKRLDNLFMRILGAVGTIVAIGVTISRLLE